MRLTFVLLLTLTVMPIASLADDNKTVIEVYRQTLQRLTTQYEKLKRLTTEAKQKVTDLENDANSIKALIAKYETALETTLQALEEKHEAQLKTVKEAYRKELAAEAGLAELARHAIEDDAKATRAILDELGTSAKNGVKQTEAVNGVKQIDGVSVSSDGKVGIGTTTPGAKLEVAGHVIRTIAYATGNGPNDSTNDGQIKSRVLSFSKAKTNTKIRISYTDNLRTAGAQKACRWEIRVDGSSCPNQALVYDYYVENNDHPHRSRTVVGYCTGIAAGSHTIGIWVGNTPAGYSGSDCYTGWYNSTWVIEAEEVN